MIVSTCILNVGCEINPNNRHNAIISRMQLINTPVTSFYNAFKFSVIKFKFNILMTYM